MINLPGVVSKGEAGDERIHPRSKRVSLQEAIVLVNTSDTK